MQRVHSMGDQRLQTTTGLPADKLPWLLPVSMIQYARVERVKEGLGNSIWGRVQGDGLLSQHLGQFHIREFKWV